MKKLLDIPTETSLIIGSLAMQEGRSAKNYMERLIINHATNVGGIVKVAKKTISKQKTKNS